LIACFPGIIDGKDYNSDLAILPGGKIQDWSFNLVTHLITPGDFKALVTDEVKQIKTRGVPGTNHAHK
jgi:hypothetical protein